MGGQDINQKTDRQNKMSLNIKDEANFKRKVEMVKPLT